MSPPSRSEKSARVSSPGRVCRQTTFRSAKKDAFLIDACSLGSLQLVRKFVEENGCSADLKCPAGKCLLQIALEGGHEEVVMYLLLEQDAVIQPAKNLDAAAAAHWGGSLGADCLHVSLVKACVEKTSDREKGFQVACEALAHSSNQTLTALLLAEMYGQVALAQPTHRHTLEGNRDIIQKVAFTLLDQSFETSDVMAVLGGTDPSFGNLSPITVAIRSHNSFFVSHPLVQDYVRYIWKGDDPLQSQFLELAAGGEESIVMDFVGRPKKWFGSPRGLFFLNIYTYLIFIIVHMLVSSDLGRTLGRPEYDVSKPGALEHVFMVLTLCGLINELEKLYRQGWANYLLFFWNYAVILLFVLLCIFMILRNITDPNGDLLIFERNVLGVSAVPLFVRLLELLVLSRRMGPLMLIIQNVLSEVFYFLSIAFIVIVAFAQAVTVLFNEPGRELPMFKTLGHSCGTLFIAMLGILDESKVDEMREQYAWMGPLTIILYLLITSVILLNLLIAILSNIYQKIDDKSNEEWMFLWASTVMRLQKEVQETLPPPLNVVLRLLKVLPKSIRVKVVFFLLMIVEWLPIVVSLLVLSIPVKIVKTIAVMFNPYDWKAGGGNPFARAKIDAVNGSGGGGMGQMGGGKGGGMGGGMRHETGFMHHPMHTISKFFEDNFTNANEMMMGRDTGASFTYDSRRRDTIIEESLLQERDNDAYLEKLQVKRDDLRDVLSMSNGDPVSLMSDLSAVQDLQGKAMDESNSKIDELKLKLDGMESLMRTINANLNALKDSNLNLNKELKNEKEKKGPASPAKIEAATAAAAAAEGGGKGGKGEGGRGKGEGEEMTALEVVAEGSNDCDDGDDADADAAPCIIPMHGKSFLPGSSSGTFSGARKTKFSRPRTMSTLNKF